MLPLTMKKASFEECEFIPFAGVYILTQFSSDWFEQNPETGYSKLD